MDRADITGARSGENPKKIGKFVMGLVIAFVIALGIALICFLHYTPIVQR